MERYNVLLDKKLYFRVSSVIPGFLRNAGIVKKLILTGSGPYEFARRLFAEGRRLFGVTPFSGSADLVFCLVSIPGGLADTARKRGLPILCRLDGVGIDAFGITREEFAATRNRLLETISISDGIIFQSEFSKQSFLSVFRNMTCPTCVVPNGMAERVFRQYAGKKRDYRGRFVVGGRNSPRKRIGQTVDRFINSRFSRNCTLQVVGDIEPQSRREHQSVTYLGRMDPADVLALVADSDGLLHLDWYDWCPNLVIEAMAAGTPVLCGKVGGTSEIVQGSGVVADLGDPEPDFSNIISSIPDIDQDRFDSAMERFVDFCKGWKGDAREDLFLSNIAGRYHGFFGQIVNSGKACA